ncbi:MrcB family domain-containing protein [Pedobacter frigidisoli]|uniref:MrcB family domain-containing protein n=1 Tax=Pedobacter frigidisoli TaxID=2530455 RepID=UPI002930DEB1|nr:DUF3578 domain-containing protein [Pedobacter frigidisoli]
MRSYFIEVLQNYDAASEENFTKHPIANTLRSAFPQAIELVTPEAEKYIFSGSAGNGRWVACPWVAILDVLVTTTTQKGYYPVYIFREDMSGFYLTLNQGVTSVSQTEKKGYRSVLKSRAEAFRSQIDYASTLFTPKEIDLKQKSSTKTSLPGDYEAGNIISKFYTLATLPTEEEMISDLKAMLSIYTKLVESNSVSSVTEGEKQEEEKIRNSNRTETEKKRLIKARLGQGDFRKGVVNIEKKCRLTGISELTFLIASHIKPWCKSNDQEKLDGNNGLLLSPHVDKLFDKGFISFSNDGNVLIKDEAKEVFESWNLKVANVGSFNKKQQEYLAYHRAAFKFLG